MISKFDSNAILPGGFTHFFFSSKKKISKSSLSLQKFSRFKDTAQALKSTTSLIESTLGKDLKKFLKKNIVDKELNEKLAVSDAKLGGIIKEELGIKCIHDSTIDEVSPSLFPCIFLFLFKRFPKISSIEERHFFLVSFS